MLQSLSLSLFVLTVIADDGGCTTFLPTTITTPSPIFVFDVVVVLVLLVSVVVVVLWLILLLLQLLPLLLFDTIRTLLLFL